MSDERVVYTTVSARATAILTIAIIAVVLAIVGIATGSDNLAASGFALMAGVMFSILVLPEANL